MATWDFERTTGAASPSPRGDSPTIDSTQAEDLPDAAVGTPEHLRLTFIRAATAADRADGIRPIAGPRTPDDLPAHRINHAADEFRALRAVVRASTTAYARRLRAEGATPESMLVLVKEVTINHRMPGFSAQELTNDIIRWSIEAYFDG